MQRSDFTIEHVIVHGLNEAEHGILEEFPELCLRIILNATRDLFKHVTIVNLRNGFLSL